MIRRRLTLGVLIGALALAGAACDEQLSDITGPTPNLQPTLSSIQQEIFSNGDSSGRQACIVCHTDQGRTPAGGLVLTDGRSYGSLVGVASRFKAGATLVSAGNPAGSYLIDKLVGAPDIVGTRMPRGTVFLTDGQVSVIRRWIELGAPNN